MLFYHWITKPPAIPDANDAVDFGKRLSRRKRLTLNTILFFLNPCTKSPKKKLDKRNKRCILMYIDKREVRP
jgi:hypothetical protein